MFVFGAAGVVFVTAPVVVFEVLVLAPVFVELVATFALRATSLLCKILYVLYAAVAVTEARINTNIRRFNRLISHHSNRVNRDLQTYEYIYFNTPSPQNHFCNCWFFGDLFCVYGFCWNS